MYQLNQMYITQEINELIVLKSNFLLLSQSFFKAKVFTVN